MRVAVLLLAAGQSRRFGAKTEKPFFRFQGRPLYMASLRVFASLPYVREIVLVVPASRVSSVFRVVRRAHNSILIRVVAGGAYRGASVANGMRALLTNSDTVLVHDSARPLLDKDLVTRVAKKAFETGAAVAAWPVPDTIKKVNAEGRVLKTIPRQNLMAAQTPQGFSMAVAKKVLVHPRVSATDDVSLAEARGIPVVAVLGRASNFKVTYRRDLELAEWIAKK